MPPALLRMQRPATGRRETECVERTAPMVSEQELIERIRRGDLVSFKAVFERYYGGVHAFTRGSSTTGSMPRRSRRTSLSASGSNGRRSIPPAISKLSSTRSPDTKSPTTSVRIATTGAGFGSTCSTTRNMCRSSSPRPTTPTGCGSWCWTRSTGCPPSGGRFSG